MIGSLAKYGIKYTEKESDDSLRNKLAKFYAGRTLTNDPITPEDQAEAFYLLLTRRLSKPAAKSSASTAGCTRRFCGRETYHNNVGFRPHRDSDRARSPSAPRRFRETTLPRVVSN